jgi:hypothetical protein
VRRLGLSRFTVSSPTSNPSLFTGNSANFACTEFSEVRALQGEPKSSSRSFGSSCLKRSLSKGGFIVLTNGLL